MNENKGSSKAKACTAKMYFYDNKEIVRLQRRVVEEESGFRRENMERKILHKYKATTHQRRRST